jgi:hypothetical protein
MKRLAAILVPALASLLAMAGTAAGAPTWKLEQPPPPPGTPFAAPLGPPGDLQFIAPNRGLLAVEGNSTIPPGIFSYDGEAWHQLAVVCGGPASHTRIAIAGPREFWTITEPSLPRRGAGTALCRFKDGAVVASYSTPLESPDPFREMDAAACTAPDDCWFGGFGTQDPDGVRRGAFHLHWNGATLETAYAPQGRGVTDLEAHAGAIFESVVVGRRPNTPGDDIDLLDPEPRPLLLHRIMGSRIASEPFVPRGFYQAPPPSPPDPVALPAGGSDLLALDSDGTRLWAGGGGAASGPDAPEAGMVSRPPLAALLLPEGWREIVFPRDVFGLKDRFVDVAAVPGAEQAWMAVETFGQRDAGQYARVALVSADGAASVTRLPANGPGRGSAAKIAFTGPAEGWMVTSAGWLFHYTDPAAAPLPRDTDPAFAGTITFRGNEAAEQFLPDAPPVDDSELFKPPPVELEQDAPPAAVQRLPALLRRIKTRVRGRTLIVRFTLARRARVSLLGRRKGRVVARTRPRMLNPGRRALRLRLNPRRWPQRLTFRVREPGQSNSAPTGDSGDTVTTGGDTIATGN